MAQAPQAPTSMPSGVKEVVFGTFGETVKKNEEHIRKIIKFIKDNRYSYRGNQEKFHKFIGGVTKLIDLEGKFASRAPPHVPRNQKGKVLREAFPVFNEMQQCLEQVFGHAPDVFFGTADLADWTKIVYPTQREIYRALHPEWEQMARRRRRNPRGLETPPSSDSDSD